MIVRRRLLFWLIKAYIKRWRKTIFLFFVFGIVLFCGLAFSMPYISSKIPVGQKQTIGIVGAYTTDNLPVPIISEISKGLTSVSPEGEILPEAAASWKIENGGKRYVFTLKPALYFTDHSPVISSNINYNFSDAKITRPNKNIIVFDLKDSYAPFLVTVSRPLLKSGFIGFGNYKLQNIKLNGNFVESITLASRTNQYNRKNYQFYSSYDAVKTAYVLGEVSVLEGLPDTAYHNTDLSKFPNTTVNKITDYSQLVTLFFNTTDPVFSSEKLRNGLSYALPDSFLQGERSHFPYAPSSWAHPDSLPEKNQNLEHARSLLSQSEAASKGAQLSFTLKTLPKFKKTAETIADAWEKINVKTKVEVVNTIPTNYQVFLGDFIVPKDPDQYSLWHSGQDTNITNYTNLRIDKLLEDGRKTINKEARKKIYTDFQKYLLADSPAAFLYFPYEYEVIRR